MKNIKSHISKLALVLRLRSEGLGLRATGRVSAPLLNGETRSADQKATLMLYAFYHEFVFLTFEGGENYTIVGKLTDLMESKG